MDNIATGFAFLTVLALLFGAYGWYRVAKRQGPDRIAEAGLVTTAAFVLGAVTLTLVVI